MKPLTRNDLKNKLPNSIELRLDPWNDVRHYKVSHATTERTRHRINHNVLTYELLLAMHANPNMIELLKKKFLLNDKPPELLSHQVLFAMKCAIYPCFFFIDKGINKLTGLQNFDFIKNRWKKVSSEINGQLNSDSVKKYIKRMEHHFVTADDLFIALKKDLLLQLLFMPLYKKQLSEDEQCSVYFEWQHPELGRHIVQGLMKTKFTTEHLCTLDFSSIKNWRESGQMPLLHKLLARFYDNKLLKSFEATTAFEITYKIDMRNGILQYCHACIETQAGNYYHDKDEVIVDYIKSSDPAPNSKFPLYKTIGLKEHSEIIA